MVVVSYYPLTPPLVTMLTLWPVELGELAVRCFHFYTDGLIRFNRDLRGIGCQLRSAQFVAAFPVVNALATAAAP